MPRSQHIHILAIEVRAQKDIKPKRVAELLNRVINNGYQDAMATLKLGMPEEQNDPDVLALRDMVINDSKVIATIDI